MQVVHIWLDNIFYELIDTFSNYYRFFHKRQHGFKQNIPLLTVLLNHDLNQVVYISIFNHYHIIDTYYPLLSVFYKKTTKFKPTTFGNKFWQENVFVNLGQIREIKFLEFQTEVAIHENLFREISQICSIHESKFRKN